jgi:DNA-binding response OmpR family regulator
MEEPLFTDSIAPLRILLVEDDDELRASLTEVLEEEGYAVVGVASGTQAISQAGTQAFDLVVTDIKMPGTDGLSALERLKADDPAIGGIVITGYSTEESASRAARMRVDNYLKKPFKMAEFLAAVDGLAERKRLEQKRRARELAAQRGVHWLSGQLLSQRLSSVPGLVGGEMASSFPDYRDPRELLALETAVVWRALTRNGLEIPGELSTLLPTRVAEAIAATNSASGLSERLEELATVLLAGDRSQLAEAPSEEDEAREDSLLNVALLLESSHRSEEAARAFEGVLAQSTDPAACYTSHFGLARLARLRRDHAALTHHASEAVSIGQKLGPLALSEALTERGLLFCLADRTDALEALQQAREAARQIRDTTSYALVNLALAHFHGQESGPLSRSLAHLALPENFSSAIGAAGWLLAFLLSRDLSSEERRFAQKLVRACPQSLERLALNTDSPRLAAGVISFFHFLSDSVRERARERFEAMEDASIRSSLVKWLGQRQSTPRWPTLRVYTFSGLRIFRDDEPMDMKRKKPLLFLVYLLYRGGPVGEDTLLEIFWPGDEAKSRQSLRHAISYLRKEISRDGPCEPFERTAAGLGLSKDVSVIFDYHEFEQQIAQGKQLKTSNPARAVECFRSAAKLYRGPFLENIYEDWALEAREQAETMLSDCLTYLAEQCLASESWAEALEHSQRGIRRDNLSQPFYEMAMRALIGLGRHHEAIALFEQGRALFQRELDLEPSIEMIRLKQMALLNV